MARLEPIREGELRDTKGQNGREKYIKKTIKQDGGVKGINGGVRGGVMDIGREKKEFNRGSVSSAGGCVYRSKQLIKLGGFNDAIVRLLCSPLSVKQV